MDSGGYELQFSTNDDWTPGKYNKIIEELNPQFFVNYDRIPSYEIQSDTSSLITQSIDFLKNYSGEKGKVLLLHFSLKNEPLNEVSLVVDTLLKFSKEFDILGVPEREIGANIFQRIQFVSDLTYELKEREIPKPIHIFGCSDPLSMILYVLAGADIFDGLGWIKFAFDRTNMRNVEYSQLPFFKCDCVSCKNVDWTKISTEEYEYRLLTHNLYAYEDFLYNFREKIINDELNEFVESLKINHYLNRFLG